MKLKTLLFSLVAGIAALTSGKASAFPLTLTSLNGTITSTSSDGTNTVWTTNRTKVVSVTLKQMLTIVSNEIFLQTSGTNAPPANSRIAFDPAKTNNQIYVTNVNYSFSLPSTNLSMSLSNIATTFRPVNPSGGSEHDTLLVSFRIAGRGLDNSNYVFGVTGKGSLVYQLRARTNSATMTISASGSAPGQYKSSADGISTGSIVFSGSGNPEWLGPFSVFDRNRTNKTLLVNP